MRRGAPNYRHPHPAYRRVSATPEEIAGYLRKHPGQRHPAVYRVECRACGKRIWGSGMGIGSHNRACPGPERTVYRIYCDDVREFGIDYTSADEAETIRLQYAEDFPAATYTVREHHIGGQTGNV
jgi:hypothetical protein